MQWKRNARFNDCSETVTEALTHTSVWPAAVTERSMKQQKHSEPLICAETTQPWLMWGTTGITGRTQLFPHCVNSLLLKSPFIIKRSELTELMYVYFPLSNKLKWSQIQNQSDWSVRNNNFSFKTSSEMYHIKLFASVSYYFKWIFYVCIRKLIK